MLFQEPAVEVQFLKRYKRFFADVRYQGEILTAHVPNTGSLKTCINEGARAIITQTSNPARKLKATLQFLETPTGWAGVNTSLPNLLAHEAWQAGLIEDWKPFKVARREYKITPETRLDLVLAPDDEALRAGKPLHHIEVKNVTYAEEGHASFPDCETARGRKHLRELMRLKEEGHGAEIVFVVQREGCRSFSPADGMDPEYGRLLRRAHDAGVRIRVLPCVIDPLKGIHLSPSELELKL